METTDHDALNRSDSPATNAEPVVFVPETHKATDPLVASILLPKKNEAPRMRENAGVLYAQEVSAGQEGFVKEEQPPASAPAPTSAPIASVPEEPSVPKLQTYQGDIQNVVSGGAVSVVSIAAAEATRRSKERPEARPISEPQTAEARTTFIRVFMVALGVILLLGAGGGIAYVALIPTTVPLPQQIDAPFITTDETTLVPLSLEATPQQVISTLTAARTASDLSVGLIERLLVTVGTTSKDTPPQEMDASTFLSLISPNVPQDVARAASGRFFLGIHSFAENQPFLIVHVDSYEQAYSGMLAWEDTMQEDLSTLFMSTPLRVPAGQKKFVTQFLHTPFVDAVIANHDTRVLQNDNGGIVLLWTFLDRNTLLITTSDGTVREVITRLHTAPLSPTP